MGAAAIVIIILFLVGLVVGGYFFYKKVTTMYFSESFIIGDVEYAFQDIDKFDKFKSKIEEFEDENDYIKFLKYIYSKNISVIYPKLKSGWILGYICSNDTTFSKINKDLLMNKFDYSVNPKYMYKDNELQEIKYNNDGIISFVSLTEDNFSGTNILKENIKKVI